MSDEAQVEPDRTEPADSETELQNEVPASPAPPALQPVLVFALTLTVVLMLPALLNDWAEAIPRAPQKRLAWEFRATPLIMLSSFGSLFAAVVFVLWNVGRAVRDRLKGRLAPWWRLALSFLPLLTLAVFHVATNTWTLRLLKLAVYGPPPR